MDHEGIELLKRPAEEGALEMWEAYLDETKVSARRAGGRWAFGWGRGEGGTTWSYERRATSGKRSKRHGSKGHLMP
jgi:hypothetical protein